MAPILISSSSSAAGLSASPFTQSLARRSAEALSTTTTTSTSQLLSTRVLRPLTSLTSSLLKRQSIVAIPALYPNLNSGPAPGTVAGIVLGSVGGFLLILWLIYTCINFGQPSYWGGGASVATTEVVRERRKSHASSRRAETVEIRRGPSPRRPSPRRPPPPMPTVERVIVEETRRESRPPPRVVERESDEVVVIEEHSPPRRSKSKRESREARETGYRNVDPRAYAGGGEPLRDIGRKSSRRSRDR